MRPECRVTIGGALASGVFMERLISCEVTDKEGVSSDTISLELNDWPPAQRPANGAIIRVWMGYAMSGMAYLGAFTVDEVEAHCLPYRLSITGKSADLRKKMKENKERHWDRRTVGSIVSEIAAEHGLTAAIDGAVGAYLYPWIGQEDESDIHFLERLAKRHDALFATKDGKLIFARRGAGLSAAGAGLSGIVVRPENLIRDTCRIRWADRAEYKEVVAYWQDREKVERQEIRWPSSPAGEAVYRLGEPFADEDEATKAATAKANELRRAGITFECEVMGMPGARAGAPLTFANVRRDADGIPFIVETARHHFIKGGGYRTALDGKLKI